VEKVASCLINIVDSFSSSVELLDMFCHQGVIEKVLPLINTGGLTSLSPSTCSNLIGLLAKLACNSLVAVKSLFELNVGNTISRILVTSDLSHGMPYLPLENQSNQVGFLTSRHLRLEGGSSSRISIEFGCNLVQFFIIS
jgi:E3 ubiquitin-protein ligase TRIP12